MVQNKRLIIALILLLGIILFVLGFDYFQRSTSIVLEGTATPLPPGSIPIFFNDNLVGAFTPQDLERLSPVSFVDPVEGIPQDGWLLRDILLLYIDKTFIQKNAEITVISTSRGKIVTLTWADVDDQKNMVMFDLSNRGTLKLVSRLDILDTRDEWIQDSDRIEVTQPSE